MCSTIAVTKGIQEYFLQGSGQFRAIVEMALNCMILTRLLLIPQETQQWVTDECFSLYLALIYIYIYATLAS